MRPLRLPHEECFAKGVSEFISMALKVSKSVQLLAYTDDIDIIGRTKRDVTAAFSAIERESTKMGLAVNEGRTKYMLSTCRNAQRIDSKVTADNYTFETVKEFVYIGSAVTTKNEVVLWSQ